MSIIWAGIEQLGRSPESLLPEARDVSTAVKWGGGLVLAGAGTVFSAFKAYRRIPERTVAIRTFNKKARDRHKNPRHALLETGGNWMFPFLHDIESVGLDQRSQVITAKVDIPATPGSKRTTQYEYEAVVTWGLKANWEADPIHPKVDFMDAYNYRYGIKHENDEGETEDEAIRVTGATESYITGCAERLPVGARTKSDLERYISEPENLQGLDISKIGLQVYNIDLNSFARAGVIQGSLRT